MTRLPKEINIKKLSKILNKTWGSQATLARRLGCNPSAISQWKLRGKIPPIWQYRLKADPFYKKYKEVL